MTFALLLWLAQAPAPASSVQVLENDHIRIVMDPGRGGTVQQLSLKGAATSPVLAEHGAGLAAEGTLLAGRVRVGTRDVEVGQTAVPVRHALTRTGDEAVLDLTVDLSSVVPSLTLERRFRLAKHEAGFRLTETLRYAGS